MNTTDIAQPDQAYQSPFQAWQIGVALLALILVIGCGFIVGGEFAAIVQASLETLPFAILAVLAYVGARRANSKVWAILWMLMLVGIIAILAILNSFLAVLVDPILRPDTEIAFIEGGQLKVAAIFLASGLAIAVGALGFVPAVRQWLSHFLPIQPESFVHTVAVSFVIMLTLVVFVPLIFLGEPPLLAIVSGFADGGEAFISRDNAGLLRDEIYGLLWMIPATIFAVGYGIRRNLHDALQRLGLVRPTLKQLLASIGLTILLIFGVIGLESMISYLWTQFNLTATDGEAFGLIFEFAINPLGAIIIGVSAGLGEELAIRGVLQPRLGIILPNLLFTGLHALQYNWDGLIVVFVIGIVFGIIRKYSNTTTCAIIHGLYDFAIIMGLVLGVPGFE